jgi:hypothetical protein
MPVYHRGMEWELILDTFDSHTEVLTLAGRQEYNLRSRSLSVFFLVKKPIKNGAR